ncbi:MAG: hypothetical protein ABIO70_06135 [Pseudomonadota bacterium]
MIRPALGFSSKLRCLLTPASRWAVLAHTGNGVGAAPEALEGLDALREADWDELWHGLLLDRFWHQGTVYVATAYAVEHVLAQGLEALDERRRDAILDWVLLCLRADRRPAPRGSHGGRWISRWDRLLLARHGIPIRSVAEVVTSYQGVIEALAVDPEYAAVAAGILGEIGREA